MSLPGTNIPVNSVLGILYNRYQGAPTLIPAAPVGQQVNQGLSNPDVYAYDSLLNQPIPSVFTAGTPVGNRTPCVGFPYIAKYTLVTIDGIAFNGTLYSSFYITGTNLLTHMIPSTYDPVGSYQVNVYVDAIEVQPNDAIYPWNIDTSAGIITFYQTNNALITTAVTMTFCRYEGTIGPDEVPVPAATSWADYLFWNNNTSTWTIGNTNITLGSNAGQTNQGTYAIAIGFQAGNYNQNQYTVAIGFEAGRTSQGQSAVAIGSQAGLNTQGQQAVAIGSSAGTNTQGTHAIAIGSQAGQNAQGSDAVAIGHLSGQSGQGQQAISIGTYASYENQGTYAIAIGFQAGMFGQTSNAVAIGNSTGYNIQGVNAVAIGNGAGKFTQGLSAVAIGFQAGQIKQGTSAVAIGTGAGQNTQGANTVAIGYEAGKDAQTSNAVAIGYQAGYWTQGQSTVAIGLQAGYLVQGDGAVAIGYQAGRTGQGQTAVAIGYQAGRTGQGQQAIAIGPIAGYNIQGVNAVAIGYYAGYNIQRVNAVAIGSEAGYYGQTSNAVAIGTAAGYNIQGTNAVAIGNGAGYFTQGQYAVAIGYQAGYSAQAANSIVINASGSAVNGSASSGFYVAPIRSNTHTLVLGYDTSTNEITYSSNITVEQINIRGLLGVIRIYDVNGSILSWEISNINGLLDFSQVSDSGKMYLAPDGQLYLVGTSNGLYLYGRGAGTILSEIYQDEATGNIIISGVGAGFNGVTINGDLTVTGVNGRIRLYEQIALPTDFWDIIHLSTNFLDFKYNGTSLGTLRNTGLLVVDGAGCGLAVNSRTYPSSLDSWTMYATGGTAASKLNIDYFNGTGSISPFTLKNNGTLELGTTAGTGTGLNFYGSGTSSIDCMNAAKGKIDFNTDGSILITAGGTSPSSLFYGNGGDLATDGATSGYYFGDRTTSTQWALYSSGNLCRLYNSINGDVFKLYDSGGLVCDNLYTHRVVIEKATTTTSPSTAGQLYVYNPTNSANQVAIIACRVAGASALACYYSLDAVGVAGWSFGMTVLTQRFVIKANWNFTGIDTMYIDRLTPSVWRTASDRRMKTNIVPYGSCLDKVLALNPVTYNWINNNAKGIGFIAQEVLEVIPELISLPDNPEDMLGIDLTNMTSFLVKAFQEQNVIIKKLEQRIKILEDSK
jgi:hypothetical protein